MRWANIRTLEIHGSNSTVACRRCVVEEGGYVVSEVRLGKCLEWEVNKQTKLWEGAVSGPPALRF